MAIVERLKQESMYGLSAKKKGHCREVAISGGSPVIELKRCTVTSDVMSNFSLISHGNLSAEASSPRKVTEVFCRKPLVNK